MACHGVSVPPQSKMTALTVIPESYVALPPVPHPSRPGRNT